MEVSPKSIKKHSEVEWNKSGICNTKFTHQRHQMSLSTRVTYVIYVIQAGRSS